MAEYYSLISNAVAALDNKTGETRRVFYGRARATLVDHLRKANPPLAETFIERELLALEDAIGKVEADAVLGEATQPTPDGLKAQSDHTENSMPSAAVEASSAQADAKLQHERRFAFWGFLILYAFWVGDLFYKPPTFSGRYDWLRLGAVGFFLALTILAYFNVRRNLPAEQEGRTYVVLASMILLGAVVVSVALHSALGWLAAASP